MARSLARISGVALRPGVSKNSRYYSPEAIAKAVDRAQTRLANDGDPITILTFHGAGDDSERIVGRVTNFGLGDDGSATYEAELADTPRARTILSLIDTDGGTAPFLRGVSIRGAWNGPVERVEMDGKMCDAARDLTIEGLDLTRNPGVDGARIDSVTPLSAGAAESVWDRHLITESVEDAAVTITEDVGEADKKPYGDVTYADPGYQKDGKARYPIDTKAHAKAAWSYVSKADNASQYTADQLAKVKARIKAACKKFGVDISEHDDLDADGPITESTEEASVTTTEQQPPTTTSTGLWADRGYRGNPRWPLDTRTQARAAWVGLTESAGQYTGPQVKRMRGRIKSALERHGVRLTTEGWLVDPPTAVTETAPVAEGFGCGDDDSGSFYVTVSDSRISVSVSSYCVEPDDLDAVARAAMDGACKALAGINVDPDEATDAATETAETASAAAVVETAPAPSETPTADPVAGPAPTNEEAAVSEPTTPAAAPAAAPSITLTGDQFAQLLDRFTPPAPPAVAPAAAQVESAPAATTTETAPAAAPVAETEDQRIARLVKEQVAVERTAFIQEMAKVYPPARKGLVESTPADGAVEGLPESLPQKPLHTYTDTERAMADRYIASVVLKDRGLGADA